MRKTRFTEEQIVKVLNEPFAQRRGRTGMVAVEPAREVLEELLSSAWSRVRYASFIAVRTMRLSLELMKSPA